LIQWWARQGSNLRLHLRLQFAEELLCATIWASRELQLSIQVLRFIGIPDSRTQIVANKCANRAEEIFRQSSLRQL
jgi:hypothetical protein